MTTTDTSCIVACFGRELWPDGTPKDETVRRAHEVGKFWHSQNRPKIDRIVCTGGWPKSMNGMPEPPAHLREGIHQRNILVNIYGVPPEKVQVESTSRKTLEQYKFPLQSGFFEYGKYSSKKLLVFAMSIPTSWRIGMLARHVLGAPDDAMYQLNPGNTEQDNNPESVRKERDLAVVQQIAITMLEQNGIRASNNPIAYLDALYLKFRPLWQQFVAGSLGTCEQLVERYRFTWPLINIPVLQY